MYARQTVRVWLLFPGPDRRGLLQRSSEVPGGVMDEDLRSRSTAVAAAVAVDAARIAAAGEGLIVLEVAIRPAWGVGRRSVPVSTAGVGLRDLRHARRIHRIKRHRLRSPEHACYRGAASGRANGCDGVDDDRGLVSESGIRICRGDPGVDGCGNDQQRSWSRCRRVPASTVK